MRRTCLVYGLSLVVAGCSNDGSNGTNGSGGSAGADQGSSLGGSGGGSSLDGGGGDAGETGGSQLSPIPGADDFDCSPAEGEPPALVLNEVAQGFVDPLFVTFAPGDTRRLFVVEQAGTIRVLVDGELQPEPFLDIEDQVLRDGNEQGLLGLAFHPDYAENGRFFVDYTARDGVNDASAGETTVSEFTSSSSPNRADPASERVLLMQPQPWANHNGGMLTFGPDGSLYIGLGDGGSGGDPRGNAQNLDSLLGSILRIDVDGSGAGEYGIPDGNVAGGLPEIWNYGLRNPWRFSFDGCSGDLYIGDVGQDDWEEVNVLRTGQGRKNFGWRVREGAHCYQANSCDFADMVEPVTEYGHGTGLSVTGGYVYRGSLVPSLRGTYFYADYDSGRFFAFEYVDGKMENQRELTEELASQRGQITSFGQDAKGELYVVRRYGVIERLEAAP